MNIKFQTKKIEIEVYLFQIHRHIFCLYTMAIDIETEIIQLKKIKDMILDRDDKSLIELILIKIKDQNNWTI